MTQTFDDWFKERSSWGLGREELLQCLLKPGNDPGDVIYISPRGGEMTRHIGTKWYDFYDAALSGWNAANANHQQ